MKKILLVPLVLLFLLILLLRFLQQERLAANSQLVGFTDQENLQFQGQVSKAAQIKRGKLVLILNRLLVERAGEIVEIPGEKLLVNARLYPSYRFGDNLIIKGKIEKPPIFNEFNYRDFLEIEQIYAIANYPQIEVLSQVSKPIPISEKFVSGVYVLRKKLESIIDQSLPEPHASLLAGILFGFERNFDLTFFEKLQQTGVLHIIVASGYNVSVVLGFVLGLSLVTGRRIGILMAIPVMIGYAVLTGLQPPIIRAVIMAGGALLAESLGRQKLSLLWLFLAAYFMLLWNPFWLKSLSFQLSFLATFGILVVAPRVEALFQAISKIKNRTLLKNDFTQSIFTTLSVQTLTLPLIFFSFNQVSLWGFLVNPLVLWIVPAIMMMGSLLIVVGLFSSQISYLVGLAVWLPLEYFVMIINLFG